MEDATPSIRVQCIGVRSNERTSRPSEDGRVFFTESHYSQSPFLVRVSFDSVSFVHRGTHVVERRFVFPGRVLHAVLANFSTHIPHNTNQDNSGLMNDWRQRHSLLQPPRHPHLCVLVRTDCLNVYTAAGEVFEVALPFQANRLFPIEGWGLLLQRSSTMHIPVTPSKQPKDAAAVALTRKNRRASTSNRGDGDRYKYSSADTGILARPRYFTLRHPLDEVKPVALSTSRTGKSEETFLSDSALDAVAVLEERASPVLVAFHREEQRFYVFQMNVIEPKWKSCWTPNVKVVDGPTWTRHRAKSDVEEVRVRIEPEWLALPLWKSPRVGLTTSKPTLLSSIVSPPFVTPSPVLSSPLASNAASITSGCTTKVSFIASGFDGFPLLCIMDKDSGTLFLKPFRQQERVSAEVDHEASDVRILHCRDAVPIRQKDNQPPYEGQGFEGSTDIVVLETDGTLMLYRAHLSICRLVLPNAKQECLAVDAVNENNLERLRLVGNVQLISVDRGDAYEIVFPNLCGVLSGKIWRCEHPLKIVSSPLLEQVLHVLDCIIPPTTLCAFKAQVICRVQAKTRSTSGDDKLVDRELEWQSFCECVKDLLPGQVGNNGRTLPFVLTCNPEETTTAPSSSSSFDALCQNKFHDMYQYEHAMLFATMELPVMVPLADNDEISNKSGQTDGKREFPKVDDYIETIFAGLHLLSEEFRLSITLFRQRLHLVDLLLDMGMQLGYDAFVTYYKEDNCILKRPARSTKLSLQHGRQGEELPCFATYGCVPDIVMWLQDKMTAKSHNLAEFPALFDDSNQLCSGHLFRHPESPLRRTKAICRAYDLMFSHPNKSAPHLPTAQSNAIKLIVYLTQDPIGCALSLSDLPAGLSFPIVHIIRQVKHHPPPFITEDVCAYVGREDLSIANAENMTVDYSGSSQQHDPTSSSSDPNIRTEDETRDDYDGLEEIISRSQPLFPADQRMKEVARLLRSSRPLCLKSEKTPDLSDLDYAQQQQARLLLLCKRSMALSVARGMVTLGSFDVVTAQTQMWRLHIPALPLAGRKPPANAIVELDLSGYARELTHWPQFHNGCATGLRLPAHDLSGVINRHWIKYHRPSVNDSTQRDARETTANQPTAATQPGAIAIRNLDEAYAAHAGLLLGIGLRGHLKCLSMADVYNYLSLSNEFVTVAIMLGMASTAAHCRRKRKQQAAMTSLVSTNDDNQSPPSVNESAEMPSLEADHFFPGFPELSSSENTPFFGTGSELALERSVSKMLCLHVPSLLPPPFGGFSVPATTQTAALLGLGILYQGTGYRLMTELLLTEIARSPSSSQFAGSSGNAGLSTASFDQLESYALAAGMALGLVVLGHGQTTTGDPGLADLKLEEKLHKYIVGGAQQYRDPNAAGSCLYRGRRWRAFGSGGNGSNSAVNGSIASNGTPSVNTEASPGAGRNTKHSSDRSGARGGGEHVNIGVTCCASALALAFMYMQTDNKTVAAQLTVPDTLILLDYVRPDNLLVRTLAKNLVMWSNISPTTQWIEEHEVPVQLQQAYNSIQNARGDTNRLEYSSDSPSHSDFRSICEAYANICTGACMSIGLRFAGTSNVVARATLRKYVLHFRELRAKAPVSSSSMLLHSGSNVVAAATERATIERCLAVCAQALALIDAGTGHVETLTLLRSITLRQRVDAAISYGNHMALSMAIGLLFLGGGRATVSRSKEAIAALVISLYPMPAMNTADNKYHLQAFRHLYVLAVDTSRLLETVDVSTKTTSAVQVQVDLFPSEKDSLDEPQPSYKVLRSPCLLPDIATIKRLVISNPEFYPIEILTSPSCDEATSMGVKTARTANSLRLDLLRDKNVVFLKRRQRKDFADFVGFIDEFELLHEVHAGGSNGGNNRDDRLRRLFRSYFTTGFVDNEDDCEDDGGQTEMVDWGSNWWSSQLSPRALEQVSDETQLLLPPYLNALHALFRLQQVPQLACAMEVMDLSLFSEYCRLEKCLQLTGDDKDSGNVNGSDFMVKRALSPEFGVWLSSQTEEALGALWYRTSLNITSLASARVQVLGEITSSMSPINQAQSAMNAFFLSVLVRYFAGPSVSSLPIAEQPRSADKDWKAKFQRVLAACSLVQSPSVATASPVHFQLSLFLDQDELTQAEKTFWLKLVSFFLFSS